MNKAILITARLKSTRLKKKIIKKYKNKTVLEYLVKRIQKNTKIPIILCTSTNPQDKPLISLSKKLNILCYAGSEDDVLKRYIDACDNFKINKMYIVYADEPFINFALLKKSFRQLKYGKKIWVRNNLFVEGSYGYGLTYEALKLIKNLTKSTNNEVWQENASKMPIIVIQNRMLNKYKKEDYRLTIDYNEDLKVFKLLLSKFKNKFFTISFYDILNYYNKMNYFSINGKRNDDYNARIKIQNVK